MFPLIDACKRLPESERETLENLDAALRLVLLQSRSANDEANDASDELNKAVVTVLMSVTADAAMLASKNMSSPTLEDFLKVARNAFEWSNRKRRVAQQRLQ